MSDKDNKDVEEQKFIKYIIEFNFEIDGIVDKSDIVGAIFGQTEGIFGPSFDLREMAKTGKIGRITPTHMEVKDRKTVGILRISTTREIEAAALIAALVESVDQVGPYRAKFRFKQIIDVREEKIKDIEKRAAEILEKWKIKKIPQAEEILENLRRVLQEKQVRMITVGREKLAAGPGIENSDEIILVEGRADVVNLVRYGVYNVLSIGGGKIPEEIRDIVKGKKVIAFLDGDRGGALNLRKLIQTVKVDYVAVAPEGIAVRCRATDVGAVEASLEADTDGVAEHDLDAAAEVPRELQFAGETIRLQIGAADPEDNVGVNLGVGVEAPEHAHLPVVDLEAE